MLTHTEDGWTGSAIPSFSWVLRVMPVKKVSVSSPERRSSSFFYVFSLLHFSQIRVCQKAPVWKLAPCDITSVKSHTSLKQLRTHAINNNHHGGAIVIIIYIASTHSESFHTSVEDTLALIVAKSKVIAARVVMMQ